MWLSSIVFDGARSMGGHIPDLDLHCQRVNRSAELLAIKPTMTPEAIEALVRDGVQVFPTGADLYISPMYYTEDGFITPIAESTKLMLSIYEAPLPPATALPPAAPHSAARIWIRRRPRRRHRAFTRTLRAPSRNPVTRVSIPP